MRRRDLRDGAVAARRIRRAAAAPFAIAFLLVLGTALTPPATAQENALSAAEERGKYIYEEGKSRSRRIITADLQRGEPPAPASILPCISCHGADGRGAEDYTGVAPLNINWYAMTAAGTHEHSNRSHAPFDEESVARAVVAGVDPDGNELDSSMPRYNISDEDVSDLIAFLKVMDSLSDPGMSSDTVRLGTVLPLEGRHAGLGKAMLDTLEAYFSVVNSTGGVQGRKLELVVGEWGSNDDPPIWAARNLVNGEPVFALVSGFVPEYDAAYEALAAEKKMPLVGPYTALPPDGSGDQTNRFTFYPISGLAQQVKVLLEAMARDHGTQGMRIGIVYPQLPDINTLAGEARTHAEKLGFGHVVDSGYAYDAFDAENLVSRMRVGVDAVLFLGSAAALQEFALEAWRADWLPYLLSPGLLAEAGVFDLPRNFSGRVLLAYASLPTDFSTQGRAEFEELHEKFGFDYSFSIAQIAAYTAAKVMVEGLHLAGRNLSREQLLESLEGLDGYHPGLAPAVSFGPGRRIGALGGHVVRPDLVNGRFEESTQWIDLGDGAVGE